MPAPAPKPTAIPQSPGVYCFRDARGRVLYVGKAANLRQRIGSYFQQGADLSPAKRRLLDEAAAVTWEELGSEIEALLREAHDIKKYQPRFNVLLRDDKTFLSVEVTDEPFPRVRPTRRIEAGGTYYGPFTDARAVKETLRVLRRLFPYRTSCQPDGGRLCLDAHLGLCPGVCGGRMSAREYQKTIRRIKLFLSGNRGRVVAALRRERRAAERRGGASAGRAARLTQQVQYLEKYLAMSHVLSFGEKVAGDVTELGRVLGLPKPPHRIEGYDISNTSGTLTTASMVVFADGQADTSGYRKFKITTVRGANDVASLREVLRRRFGKHPDWPTPDLVVVDGGRPQLGAALGVWRELRLAVPLIALAKRREEVFTPASPDPLVLPRTSGALHLLERVRDEAHRFAVSYHKLLRRKRLLGR